MKGTGQGKPRHLQDFRSLIDLGFNGVNGPGGFRLPHILRVNQGTVRGFPGLEGEVLRVFVLAASVVGFRRARVGVTQPLTDRLNGHTELLEAHCVGGS